MSSSETMEAYAIAQFGGPEELVRMDLPIPIPSDGEVQIRLHATSVNPVDWKIRRGYLKQMFAHEFPLIPGWDAVGTVSAVGAGVGRPLGQRVWAYCRRPLIRDGTYAQYVCVPDSFVAEMPSGLSFAEAACVPLVGLTSYQSLVVKANLEKGQRVLIHAGAGGIGSLAIQIAHSIGAKVYTTASAANSAYVRSLGADVVIDYRAEDFEEVVRAAEPEGIDVVFDTIGGDRTKSFRVLRRGGVIVSIVKPPTPEEAEPYGVLTAFVFVEPSGEQLTELKRMFDSGALVAVHHEVLPLCDARAAQERSEEGHVRGKLVLRIAEE